MDPETLKAILSMRSILLVIYKLNCPPPKYVLALVKDNRRHVWITYDSIKFETSQMVPTFSDGTTRAELRGFKHELPVETYLIIELQFESPPPMMPYEGRAVASAEAAAIAAAVEATEPHVLLEKVVEEVPNSPGRQVSSNVGPMKFTSRPPTAPEQMSTTFKTAIERVAQMTDEERSVFAICARWYWKGYETLNEVDRFLSWYIVLEIFPARETTDVTNRVAHFVTNEFHPDSDRQTVKKRLRLGRVTGLRGDIVHSGITLIGSGKVKEVTELMEILEALVRAILRYLSGETYDGTLDKWMRTDA